MSDNVNRNTVIKRMTELLRSGAIMLDQACPACGSPLFKLRSGEVVCPIHGPIRVVKTEQEAIEVTTDAVLDEIEKMFSERAVDVLRRLRTVKEDINESEELIKLLIYWLDILERVRRIKGMKFSETKKK